MTSNNYIKFDPLLYRIPNIAIQISSLDSLGRAMETGDVVIQDNCVGCTPATEICSIDCIGRTNSWKITAYD